MSKGYKIVLTDRDGVLITVFLVGGTDGYDLSKPIAVDDLIQEIKTAIVASEENDED